MPGENEVRIGGAEAGVVDPNAPAPKEGEQQQQKPAAEQKPAPTERPAAEQKPAGEEKPLTSLKIEKPVETPKIDLSKALTEFGKDGKVSDATYAAAEKQGMTRADVDTYLAGHQARVQGVVTKLSEIAGSQENLRSVIEWAGANTDDATRDAFNAAMEQGNLAVASLMVRGLVTQYNEAVGVDGDRVVGTRAGTGVAPYANWAQVSADMSKPQYQKDPAFRKNVEDRLRVSAL